MSSVSRAAVLIFAWAGLGLAGAAQPAESTPPSVRIAGADYVRATDVAAQLDLSLGWEAPDRLTLSGPSGSAEFAAGSRDALIGGLRVFLGQPAALHGGQLYFGRIDFERRLRPLLRPDLAGPPPPCPPVIAIDPGHGGLDHGTENPRLRLMEKTFTLAVALRLKPLLEARGYRVVLTRERDVDVSKPQRAEIANLARAGLFLSLHFNSAAPDTRTKGTEVFSFAPQGQRSSDSWRSGGKDDSESEASPANREDAWSAVLAHCLHRELRRRVGTDDRGEKIAHFAVLRPLDCPGALVELAFLSNDAEAERVATPEFQQRLAEAVLAGIQAYRAEIRALSAPRR